MNKPLSDEEEKAVEKLLKLRVGALYASDREVSVRVAAKILLSRMNARKADGAIWLVSSGEAALLARMMDEIPGDVKKRVRIAAFQSLSHNEELFFELLRLTRSMRTMLIIDDGLYIKNVNAVRTHRVWMIAEGCPYRMLLADAPFERNQEDMFSQWYALDARILGYISYWGFCVNHIKHGRLINGDYLSRAIAPYSACIERSERAKAQRKEYVWQFRLPDSVYEEYRSVAGRFEKKALYSAAGIYKMLVACHLVASGRRIVRDYPLETESVYKNASDDPRLQALFEVLARIDRGKTLIVCRFHFEIETVREALSKAYGERAVQTAHSLNADAVYYVESLYLEKRALLKREFQTLIYYSQNWSLRKRREREDSFKDIGCETIINIVAADTIDAQMVKWVWKKERRIEDIYRLLTEQREVKTDAQGVQG